MSDYLVGHNSNTEGEFAATRETDAVIWRARESAAAFVGGQPEEISFGQNMTSLNFNLARAVGRTMSPGDEIVVTQLDHDANVSPWLLLAQDRDFVVRTVGLTQTHYQRFQYNLKNAILRCLLCFVRELYF